MNCSISSSKNQSLSGKNKPVPEPNQVLLKTGDLLNCSPTFIGDDLKKDAEMLLKSVFQLLFKMTHLSTWLGHVTVFFLGFSNKNHAHFLIPKFLSTTRSSFYCIATSTV